MNIDTFKRNRFKVLPWMYNAKCTCCNWTLIGNKRKKRRLVNKSIRARIKNETRILGLEEKGE